MLINDIEILSNDYYKAIYDILFYSTMLSISLLMYVYIDITMLLFVAFAGFSSVVVPRLLDKKLKVLRNNYSISLSSYTGYSKELLAGKNLIDYFLVFTSFFSIYKQQTDKTAACDFKFKKLYSLSNGLASFVSNALFFIVLLFGIILVLKGRISLGYMVAASNLSNFVIIPCQVISSRYAKLKACQPIKEKINNIILSYKDDSEKIALNCKIDCISLNNVSFSYSKEKNILNKANLLWENNKVAIIGESGAGKSTIVKLLQKQVSDYQGSVKINDTEIKKISDNFIWKNIGYIQQTPFIFNDTIRNNVTLYDNYTDEEIYAVLSEIGMIDFVKKQVNGLDSIISENGKNLSGGQAQRIAIARVLIRKYDWIIADEVTSNLDGNSKKQIIEALFNKASNLLVITHDTQSDYMKKFDKVYELKDGSLLEVFQNQKG